MFTVNLLLGDVSASRSHASFARLFTQPFSCVWLYLLLFCLWPDNYSAVINMHAHIHSLTPMHTHVHTHRHACTYTLHMDTHVHDIYTNAHILLHKCTIYTWCVHITHKIYSHIYRWTHKDTCTHAHVYIHTYTINTHAYMYIHMQRCTQVCTHNTHVCASHAHIYYVGSCAHELWCGVNEEMSQHYTSQSVCLHQSSLNCKLSRKYEPVLTTISTWRVILLYLKKTDII